METGLRSGIGIAILISHFVLSVRVTIQPPGLLPHGPATAPTISQPHATTNVDVDIGPHLPKGNNSTARNLPVDVFS